MWLYGVPPGSLLIGHRHIPQSSGRHWQGGCFTSFDMALRATACAEASEGPTPEEHPLLPPDAEQDILWNDVEQAGADPNQDGSAGEQIVKECRSMAELLRDKPHCLLQFLQDHGVMCLGAFKVEDRLLLGKVAGDAILTMGADRPDLDYERAWRRHLGACSSKYTGWRTALRVLAYVVTIRGATYPGDEGLLHPLLTRWQAGGCSFTAFALPAVQAVIDWKWTRFCEKLLFWELFIFLTWLASYWLFILAIQGEDPALSLRQLLGTPWGQLAVASDLVGLAAMSPFLVIELRTIAAYGWSWLSSWNVLSSLSIALQIVIAVRHLTRTWVEPGFLPIAMAVQCVLLLLRVQYFSRVFRPTRFAFVDSIAEVLHDLKYYLLFLVLLIGGFASAFFVLFRQDQADHQEFSSLGRAFVTMVAWLAGDPNLTLAYNHSTHPLAACLLAIAYVFILGLVLLNLLVGLMTNTLNKVTENESLRLLLSKAQIIDELEATLPRCVRRFFPQLYPPYLHVFRVDPGSLDKVDLDTLWGPTPPASATSAAAAAASQATSQVLGSVGHQELPRGEGASGKQAGQGTEADGGGGVVSAQLARLQQEQHELRGQVAELKAILLRQQRER